MSYCCHTSVGVEAVQLFLFPDNYYFWSCPHFNIFPVVRSSVPGISEEIAREALIEYIGGKCCYSTTKAKDLRIVGLETSSIHTVRVD